MGFNWKQWSVAFLGVTAIAVAMELIAALDGNGETVPWTQYITTYIPQGVFWPVVGLFFTWFTYHFYTKYQEKGKKK